VHVPSTDGVSVAVHDLGGTGDPLVIAHATGFCGMAYEPLAAGLRHRFHVWALDFRGHGDSTAPALDLLAWDRMVDDLDAAVTAVAGDTPIAVVGHSMGGACALRLESRRPGTFRWAYVFEPIVLPAGIERTGPNPLAESATRRRPTFPSRADALLRYSGRPPLNVLRADSLHAYVVHGFREDADGTVRLKCSPAHEAGTFAASGGITLDHLADVHIPVTVAAGVADGGMPAMLAPEQVAALPRGRLEQHTTLGHFGPLQDPTAIAAAILAAAGA
jgi:pimeloyl-ACP methyl ester carboxylesterase